MPFGAAWPLAGDATGVVTVQAAAPFRSTTATRVDVRLYQANDGGEIDLVNRQLVMADGLETAAYLSLFGGNERDSAGADGEALQWWGNLGEALPERTYRSELQHLLRALPLVPANLRRLEDAAGRDLAWMVTTGLASGVAASASMPRLNTVQLDVEIQISDSSFQLSFLSRKAA